MSLLVVTVQHGYEQQLEVHDDLPVSHQ